jgi:hypothetical protein
LSGVAVCSSPAASASVTVSGILPAKFLNVSANKAVNGTIITWQVTNEENVAFYTIEKSSDCIHFEKAGQVNYTVTSASKYSYIDQLQVSSKLCYRIRQVDNNGNYVYSQIVMIKPSEGLVFQVVPNPASSKANLFVESTKNESAILSLVGVGGNHIRQEKVHLNVGSNSILITELELLPKGLYIIQLTTYGQIYYQKLVVH